ncbi:ATP-binding protein [Pseudoalteromonas sp. NBT06-2]|uniref:ATP-binding protein n=1 Tax=Pseudoalteromonas sp. NBT06-2 TaxID=2025950 RepID=UPI002074F96C|nr:ATP-binding protein [Pseudoalteromonas sp. NBT06-2]
MIDYVNTKEIEQLKPLITQLQTVYSKKNSWDSLENNHRQFQRMIASQLQNTEFEPPIKKRPQRRKDQRRPPRDGYRQKYQTDLEGFPEPKHPKRPKDVYGNEHNKKSPSINDKRPPPKPKVSYAVLDSEQNYIVGHFDKKRDYSLTPITLNTAVIGYFAISKRHKLAQGYELDFIKQQQSYIWLIGLGVMVLVIIITLPLARHLVQPIRQLKSGMHKLTQGNYSQNLDVKRQDEFGQLNRDFNELTQALDKNETARKRWLANISHELRTPVAILKGEIEAMLDGIRPLNLDNIKSTQEEVAHLQKLIEDLHQLTSADIGAMKYRKKNTNLADLINKESNRYEGYVTDAGLCFEYTQYAKVINVYVDQTRICQLLDNLINNGIKYAYSGSQIQLSLSVNKKVAKIIVEDDGPGVAERHLPYLFEHLYRVENSRNRGTGGTGLGLSICAHIIEAHQGEITASRSILGGLKVTITLPLF